MPKNDSASEAHEGVKNLRLHPLLTPQEKSLHYSQYDLEI